MNVVTVDWWRCQDSELRLYFLGSGSTTGLFANMGSILGSGSTTELFAKMASTLGSGFILCLDSRLIKVKIILALEYLSWAHILTHSLFLRLWNFGLLSLCQKFLELGLIKSKIEFNHQSVSPSSNNPQKWPWAQKPKSWGSSCKWVKIKITPPAFKM